MNYKEMTIAEKKEELFTLYRQYLQKGKEGVVFETEKHNYCDEENLKYKINSDFIRLNSRGDCYREIMVSFLPMLPLLENNVSIEKADYILYTHAFARIGEASELVLKQLRFIDKIRKDGAEIIVVGKAANAETLLNGSIKNITFWHDHYTEKLGKKFEIDIKEQFFVYDDEQEHLAIWPVNGCLRKCKFCRRSYMHIPFESLSLDYIKEKLDWYKENHPERMKWINLRAENLTEYGIDIYGCQKFPELIELISKYDEVEEIEFAIGMALSEITDEILKSICDCKKIKFTVLNIETGTNRLLNLVNKGVTIERIKYIFKTIRETRPDIKIASLIIIGLPTETISDMYELADVMSELMPYVIKCNIYTDSPGLPLHQLPQLSQQLMEYHIEIFLKQFRKCVKKSCWLLYPQIGKRFKRKRQREIEKDKYECDGFSCDVQITEWCCKER